MINETPLPHPLYMILILSLSTFLLTHQVLATLAIFESKKANSIPTLGLWNCYFLSLKFAWPAPSFHSDLILNVPLPRSPWFPILFYLPWSFTLSSFGGKNLFCFSFVFFTELINTEKFFSLLNVVPPILFSPC